MSARSAYKNTVVITLSPRQYQVIALIAQGYVQKEVAQKLHISHSTVGSILQSLYDKIDAKNTADAIYILTKNGTLK